MLYKKCGQQERSINILEDYLKKNPKDTDVGVLHLLASLLMSENEHKKALQHIHYAHQTDSDVKELPVELLIKAGICHVHRGNLEKAEDCFSVLTQNNVNDRCHLVLEVADSLMTVKNHESALKYYLMLEGNACCNKGLLSLNIGRCYYFLSARAQAIDYLYRALQELDYDDIDARLDLVSYLLEEDKEDEAISVLSSPPDSESRVGLTSDTWKPWWTDSKIKLKLAYIYKSKGLTEAFVDAVYPLVRETLFLETIQRKARKKRRLPKSVLYKRLQVLDEQQTDRGVFRKFYPIASSSDLSKAARAKKLLQKKEKKREEKQAAALAAGIEWQTDKSDDESPAAYREPPLPNLLKDDDQLTLIVDLCKGLVSVKKYWKAREIVTSSLKLAQNTLSTANQEELRALRAEIAYNIDSPRDDYARDIVTQNPYNFAAWNCYYKIMLRSRLDKHKKFLQEKFVKHEDCIPVLLIKGHQFSMRNQHQAAASCYLKAYKLMPENALVNLCVGTALINLALGSRLHDKSRCVLQGLAFLYNNLRLSENSQEALYNLARAYHLVGLVSHAVTYYEKVLAVHQKDHPIPKLLNDGLEITDDDLKPPGYCDLKREAAYNLHLIYKSSGSVDLARQVLKDHSSME